MDYLHAHANCTHVAHTSTHAHTRTHTPTSPHAHTHRRHVRRDAVLPHAAAAEAGGHQCAHGLTQLGTAAPQPLPPPAEGVHVSGGERGPGTVCVCVVRVCVCIRSSCVSYRHVELPLNLAEMMSMLLSVHGHQILVDGCFNGQCVHTQASADACAPHTNVPQDDTHTHTWPPHTHTRARMHTLRHTHTRAPSLHPSSSSPPLLG